MAEETRALKRRHLIYYLEVYDDEQDLLLGHIVDITTAGLKLVSKKPIETGRDFKLRMNLPESYFKEGTVFFDGKSLWSGNDINPDFYDTGFSIANLNHKAIKTIEKLVKELAFNM